MATTEADVRPPAGIYVIVNRVLSPNDERLAINFNGSDKPLTVKIRADSAPQRWIVKDYDAKTQAVVPESAPSLQAAWGSGFVTVLPQHNYVWTIRQTNSGYTIQDGGVTVYWGLADAVNDAKVTIGAGTGNEKQRWFLQRLV
ncbi:hypothetical protein DFH29DRAFT_75286 [Suillus ampliporus]|nr:hypothetical protein DFH29DRAFT_75286 [Suillus ampliporus]